MDTTSPWVPFRHKAFLILWIAGLISNIGTWIFNVTCGWMMTNLSTSPLMISLVQAATTLPICLFALPAGALGDIFDRRTVLLCAQISLSIILLCFVILLAVDVVTPWLLLTFTFLTGVGTAFSMPVWLAIVQRLVTKEELHAAVALSGVSMNIARAVGPAIGGYILISFGAIYAVGIDALSYLAVVGALLWWQIAIKIESTLPRERILGAMKAGIRFTRHSKALKSTLIRSFAFLFFAASYWALLPLIAKTLLQGGADLYGLLFGGIGVGAVTGAVILPTLKKVLGVEGLVISGTLGTALAISLFVMVNQPEYAFIASCIAGAAWMMVLSSLNVSAQVALPDWIRARGLAILQVVFFGGMALGAIVWGQLATFYSVEMSLRLSAIGMLLLVPLTWRWKLNLGEFHDYTPSRHWAEPNLVLSVKHQDGPVLISVEYLVAEENRSLFEKRIWHLGIIRKRDGAMFWGVFEDVERPGRYLEMFVDESWASHLRSHERVSHSDREVESLLVSLHLGPEKPKVTHAVAPNGKKNMPDNR